MVTKKIAKEWYSFATMDLQSAHYLLNMRPTPLEIICYHCQQAAEKYLKGFIALHGGELQKTHDLVILNKLCQQYDHDFSSIEDDCINLTDYGVQVRYPFQIDLTVEDMKLALNSAERIKDFVLKKS